MWLPAQLYDAPNIDILVSTQACLTSAAGPTGVPCYSEPVKFNQAAPKAGSCAWYRCLGPYVLGASFLEPYPNALWQRYFPEHFSSQQNGAPACVVTVQSALFNWEVSLPLTTQCAYTLPTMFSARGWGCASGSIISLSPSPSAAPSPTGTPTQTVSSGLTRTLTPTQTVTSLLTPTSSPQWGPSSGSSGHSVADNGNTAGLAAGVTIAVLVLVAAAVGATLWFLRNGRMRALWKTKTGNSIAVAQGNPAFGARAAVPWA